jgi:PKD repeat protein
MVKKIFMKKIELILLFIVFSFVSNKAQTCTADGTVTFTGNPGEILVTDNSFSVPAGTLVRSYIQINYSGGGGAASADLQPYSTTQTLDLYDGSYNFYINYFDSLSNCVDVFLGNFIVSGNPVPPTPTCNVYFNHSLNPSNHYEVNFVSTGTNNPTVNHLWDFGDGTSSIAQNPIHLYATAGTKIVSHTITDTTGVGCTNTGIDTIQCGDFCSGLFSYSVNNSGSYYSFSQNTNLPGYTYSWDFGDGTNGTYTNQQTPTHSYGVGSFNVCMTMSNGSCSSTSCSIINVIHNCNSDFNLSRDSSNMSIQNYVAYNSSYGVNLNYLWDFGDGNTSSQAYPTHVYNGIGTYNVCLTVSDNNGCSDTYCEPLNVVLKSVDQATLNVLQPGQFLSMEVYEKSEFKLYPNPTNNFLQIIGTPIMGVAEIKIFDITGKELLRTRSEILENEIIDVTVLEKGTYFISVDFVEKNKSMIKKFIKN